MSHDDQSGRQMGRPKSKNPLSYNIYIRLTEADGQLLDFLAEFYKRDRAEMARFYVLEGVKKMKRQISPEFNILVRKADGSGTANVFSAESHLGGVVHPDDIKDTGQTIVDTQYPDFTPQLYTGLSGFLFSLKKGVTLDHLKSYLALSSAR